MPNNDGIVPGSQAGRLQFYQEHQPVWEASFADIGLTAEQAAALKTLVSGAEAALLARDDARSKARATTEALNDSLNAMTSFGSSLITTIRGYAESTDDASVYQTAQIPAPKPPVPAPPATAPVDFIADPNADGTINLKWKGTISQNQSFDIERSIDGSPFTLIRNVRAKKWTDNAVPQNSNVIVYRAYGVRDMARSTASVSAYVNFGNVPASQFAAFVTNFNASDELKNAA